MITIRHALAAQLAIGLLLLVAISGQGAPARAAQTAATSKVYLPMVSGPQPRPAPAPGRPPAQLIGTWYSGQLLNLNIYNRETGVWGDAGGLGHMYIFGADGAYTRVSYLKLGEGTTCVSSVATYESGAAQVSGGALLLTPRAARTRTVTCGAPASDIEGDHATYRLPWRVGEDESSHTRLWLDEAQGRTEYYKGGVGPQVLGSWANGDGGAIGLYDPESGAWADPSGEGSEWFAFSADGAFRHGRVDGGFGSDPCRPMTMTYEEGAMGGSGGDITLTTTTSLRHTVHPCAPAETIDETLAAGDDARWTWAIPAGSAGSRIDLLRVRGGFYSVTLSKVE